MKEYNNEFLRQQRGRLEQMREELREALELNTELFNELMNQVQIKDRPEVGTEEIDSRRFGVIETVDRERIRRISGALHRLDQGDYGFCQICGAPIGEERLKAKPDALLCINCKERRENEGAEASEL